MRLITRLERLERLRGTGTAIPTDKVPLEVFRRMVEGTNTQAEWERWGPLVRQMAADACAAVKEFPASESSEVGRDKSEYR